MNRSATDLSPMASATVNDENCSPSSEMLGGRSVLKFSPIPLTATLRQSQRDNIRDNVDVIAMKSKGSLQNPRPLPVTPTRYEEVLKLDEEESWKERCAVITRPDHEEYVHLAQDILVDLIENLPIEITPVKPDNLDVPSAETHSVSSTDFTPSESSFDTAREELLSLSLLPDLLQPETLHDWRADSDRSDTDYESATDSGEVAAISDSPDDNLSVAAYTSSFRDQFGDDRETTPVPQLLVDNQPPATVINRSFVTHSDREKTPIPSNTSFLLPDLASQSFGALDAASLVEDFVPRDNLDNTLQEINGECSTPATKENTASVFSPGVCKESLNAINEHNTTYSQDSVVISTAAVESNSETLSSEIHVEAEHSYTEAVRPVLSVENGICSEVGTADVLPVIEEKAVSLQTVPCTETTTSDLQAFPLVEENLVTFEAAADKEVSSGGSLLSIKREVEDEASVLEVNANALNEENKVEVAPVECLAPVENTTDTVSTVGKETTVEDKVEKVILNNCIESFDLQTSELEAQTLVNNAHKVSSNNNEPAVVESEHVNDLPAENHHCAELVDSSSGVICELSSTLTSGSAEILCNSADERVTISTDQKSEEVRPIVEKDTDKRDQNLVSNLVDAPEVDAQQLLNQTFEVVVEPSGVCEGESELSVTDSVAHDLPAFVPEPLVGASDDQNQAADVSLNRSPSLHQFDSTFVVDPAIVASAEDQCRIVRDLLPASQEASDDIKQLLERAARAVAKLHDTYPPGSPDFVCGILSSPRATLNQSVESLVSQDSVVKVEFQESTADIPVLGQADSSVKEAVHEEVNSLETKYSTVSWNNSVEHCDKPQVDFLCKDETSQSETKIENGVIDPPFDLDQRLELEATIIAAELINLSLRENEEGETDQSMKDNKMADLENNESSRVGGDVAPNLDENVNPFQSKPRVVCSPMRAPNANGDAAGEALKTPILGSKGLKNGEVAAKVASSGARTPTRKTSSPSSRTTPLSNSPKRKGSSSLESGLAEGERENGVGSPFTPSNRLGRSPPRTPARDSNKEHLRKTPVKAAGSPPKEMVGKPSTPGSIDGSGEGFTRSAPEGAPAQAEHGSEMDLSSEFKRPLPKPAPRVKANSDSSAGSPGMNTSSAVTPTNGCDPSVEGGQMMVRSVEERVNSEAGPDVAEFADGEFRSAADVFKDPAAFEFLQMAGNKQLSESALARMSLYVKFDPLLKAISPVSRRSLSKCSTSDHSQSSGMSEPSGDDLLLGTPSKSAPMLDLSSTPGKGDGCSDGHLLDLTPFKSHEGQSSGHQYSEEEFAQALRMQELLFQEQLITKDREWDERTRRQEKEHEMRAGQLIADNERLVHEFQKLQESHQQMNQIVSEYEKTISQLITDRESEKLATDDRAALLKRERDQALEDLQSVEGAFADLHRRYEKSKVAVDGFKKNEEVLKTYVAEGQSKLKKQEQKYEMLKTHAEEKLECANAEIESLRQSSEAELAALRAQLKKSEMKVNGLERSLETKTKENAELTNICDELIAKVGHRNS